MDALGISLTDEEGNMKTLSQVMGDLRSGFGELMISEDEFNETLATMNTNLEEGHITQKQYDEELELLAERAFGAEGAEKARYAAMLAGKEGMSGLLAIVNASEEDYQKLTGAINDSSGAAQEMADTMNDNLGGDIKEMNSALEELQLKIYDSVQQPMRDIVQFITGSVIPAATQVLQFIQQHATAFGVLAGVIGVITAAMLLQNTVQAVKTAMDAAETASLGGLIAAKVASAAASWAALAPYIAIVAAIAAVIAIIVICVTHWDQIKQKVTEVATTVKTKVTQAWNNLKTNMSNVMDNIRSKVQSAWQTIKTNIINPIQDAYNNVTQKISDLKSKIEEKINDIKSKVQETFQSIREKMESPIQAAKDTIDGIISTIKGWFPLSIGNIFSNLKLPHFSISGEFSLNPPSIPHIGVDWYAKGAVFDAATIIPTLYGLKGVGEKEPEAVSPVSVLQSYVGAAVQRFVPQIDYDLLAEKVAWACAKMNISIDVDKRQLGRVVREVVT